MVAIIILLLFLFYNPTLRMQGNNSKAPTAGAIGVFDSGYGGLTILNEIRALMPQYDYLYLGDNARTPYGSRSFEVVYEFTRQAVLRLFEEGCQLVILACNTASAKALRSIQQVDLPQIDAHKRVLGVIRPTVELVGNVTQTKHVGILGTVGTIQSSSYQLEIEKLWGDITVYGQACPMWVPLVENGEHQSEGADYFVKQRLNDLFAQSSQIDTIILGCTHYPLLLSKIQQYLPSGDKVTVIPQGEWVARSLQDYLQRHPEMDTLCTKGGSCRFYTTEQEEKFEQAASLFLDQEIKAQRVVIDK